MPLEATMIIIDNSEYMRNGDYIPSRFEAQSDAVKTIFQTKIDSNPENTVGVMTMANKGAEVLVTHSKDIGQIIKALHVTSSKIGGSIDIPTAINIAQLALKHRENKNLRQRIIVFVGSPLEGQGADEREMVKLAKRLKKNNVAVDFVAFGDGVEEDTNVLKVFVDNTTSSDNSHLVSVPPGSHLLSDMIISSPILSEDRGVPPEAMGDVGGASGSGGANFEFGVDPSLDPELAMALRMSMEEEQARQAAEEQTRQATVEPQLEPAVDKDDEAVILAQGLAMSERNDIEMGEDEDEEEAIARAIQMSMKQEEKEQ
ncbi:uncharacterized protein EDB91DRAFT_1345152 [Suillus paluster]|uniref:uncharacterized protein n=1 Tax=Suillus paluster TaxID=48578 RepID=UPI001B864A84|nr:uncharacterized protein EDB91DRAFT_1345152 [Suillus paluster]KAG1747061.1 hypothetical protein EDB91DRAFT_1345152 [Suillus paluster]